MRGVAKKKNTRPPSRKSAPVAAAPAASSSPSSFPGGRVSGAVAAALLAAGFACAALLYDSAAEASFDAPKRAAALLAVAGAALALSAGSRWRLTGVFAGGPLRGWDDLRIPLALALAAGALTIVSAFVSPHRALSLDSLRATALLALVLPLGASPALARRLSWLVAALLGALGVDALVSILQARGLYQPFPLVTHGDREATGAFAGNVAYLALATALGAVVAAGLALTRRGPAARWTAGALGLLFAASLLVNRNLTALSALAAGVAVLAIALAGRRALLPLAGAVLALGLAVALYAPMRSRFAEVRRAVAAG